MVRRVVAGRMISLAKNLNVDLFLDVIQLINVHLHKMACHALEVHLWGYRLRLYATQGKILHAFFHQH